MPVRRLPSSPSLDHLRYQAKDLLSEHAARDPGAAQRIREFHPRFAGVTDAEIFDTHLRLSDAQLAIAREFGFPSWARLRRHIEKPTLTDQLNLPHHARIEDVTFRRGKLPRNILELAKVILEAGVEQSALNETLLLVATGRVPRECDVQLGLIGLLCHGGADPNSAIRAATLHGEFEAVNALIKRGARIDWPVAAALGRIDEAPGLLLNASGEDRHLALSLAATFGQVEIVRLLLDAGEDPNRYNPVGGHSHTTPLHQAAGAGHDQVVRLLVEHGARLDIKDLLWHATPADWARHAGRAELEAYLRTRDMRRKQED